MIFLHLVTLVFSCDSFARVGWLVVVVATDADIFSPIMGAYRHLVLVLLLPLLQVSWRDFHLATILA